MELTIGERLKLVNLDLMVGAGGVFTIKCKSCAKVSYRAEGGGVVERTDMVG